MKAFVHFCDKLRGRVDPPSSKNYTTRYLLVSSLAKGTSRVLRPAVSEDALAMVECARTFGARVRALDRHGKEIPFALESGDNIESVVVDGFGGDPQLTRPDGQPDPDPLNPSVTVNPHNAGAVLRMMLGVGALLPCARFFTDHPESLGQRPNRDLLLALGRIGVNWEARSTAGELPITLRGGRERIAAALERLAREQSGGGPPRIFVSGAVSSQFVSSILFLAPLLGRHVDVEVTDVLRSRPLVETTLEVMREAGIVVTSTDDCLHHRVAAGDGYQARDWAVHGDWPGASALLAAAAVIPGSEIEIERLYDDLQGERWTLEVLTVMGCSTRRHTDAERGVPVVALSAPQSGQLEAIEIDGDRSTDAVLALYATAALAKGQTRIYGIRNLQFKECDRIRAPLAELRKIYATAPEFQRRKGEPDEAALDRALRWTPEDDPDEVIIEGCPAGFEGGIEVDGHGDHRVIMALSIVGLRCRKGITIRGAEHVAKSYPRWFDDLASLGARIDRAEE